MKRRYQVQDQIYCVALVALLFPLDTEVLRPLEVEKEAQVKRAGYKAISAIRKYIDTEEQRKRLGWSLKLKVPKEEQQENAELALPLNGCFGYGSRRAKRPIRQRPMELKSTPALRILNITRQLGTLACVLAQDAITVPWHLAGIIIGAPAQLQLTSVSLSHATTVAVDGFEDMNKNEQTTHQEQ